MYHILFFAVNPFSYAANQICLVRMSTVPIFFRYLTDTVQIQKNGIVHFRNLVVIVVKGLTNLSLAANKRDIGKQC